jgi:hypothetical protein
MADLIYFSGVSLRPDQMSGFISSDQLIDKFNKSWIMWYQRGRVPSQQKIMGLRSVFTSKGHIDSIKINLVGELTLDKKRGDALLQGEFHVIDGQQRLYALKESGVRDMNMPVELYLNISMTEEVKLFHQFNKDQTKLKFGELAKSTSGPFGDSVRALLNRKDSLAMPLSINGSPTAINLSTFCPMVHCTHRRIFRDFKITNQSAGKPLLSFLADASIPKDEVAITMYAARNVVAEAVNLFGKYDSKATAYRRSFFTAWYMVVIHNFLNGSGKVDYGKFKAKMKDVGDKVLLNARVREIVKVGGEGAADFIYDVIIEHLNHKLKDGRLPLLQEIVQSAKASEHAVGSVRSNIIRTSVENSRQAAIAARGR